MFLNFIKVTLRILYREKIYAIINIAGLSIAIACCLILGLYLKSELSYDRHYTKHKQIYRIANEYNTNGKPDNTALTAHVLGEMLVEEYPEIREAVRLNVLRSRKDLFMFEDKKFYWENVTFASDNIFKVFNHEIIYGDPETALVDPASVAVSETFAKKYFGDSNPVGKIIDSENRSHKITLVFADLPENTHLKYDVLLSINFWKQTVYYPKGTTERHKDLWDSPLSLYTYVLMPENYDIEKFRDISVSFYDRHMAEEGKATNRTWKCWLQPLTDIHYHSSLGDDEPVGNKFYLYGFIAVALFIMLVAAINYMNLATARAAKRSKEVGMQKILGSGRARLILQFIGEAVFFSMIAMIMSVFLVKVILAVTPISEIMGKTLVLDLYNDPALPGLIVLFSLALALISGIYPAVFLSSVMPLSALVSKSRSGKGSIRLRGVLVLIQFTVSVCVIACTLIMSLQMRYISGKSLGFKKEHRMIVTLRGADLIEKVPTIKKELLKDRATMGVSYCSGIIGKTAGPEEAMIENNDNVPELRKVSSMIISKDFIEVMGMELTAGHDFSGDLQQEDSEIKYIVNETMVESMGWDQPLNKNIEIDGSRGKVIGVVKDFHYASLKSNIEPFAFRKYTGVSVAQPNLRKYVNGFMVVKIDGKEIPHSISLLKEVFNEFDPEHPLEFEFLDAALNKVYQSEDRLMKMIGIFAGVCIFISCLGLFGLAAFTTEQRTREIGIRKVLGASTWGIIVMLSNQIMMLVSGGAVLASLVAYFVMDDWLADFAYRISINKDIWVFLIAAAVAACVAFVTIALQSFKSARTDPVDALRYE